MRAWLAYLSGMLEAQNHLQVKVNYFAVQASEGRGGKKQGTCFLYCQSTFVLLGLYYIFYLPETAQPRVRLKSLAVHIFSWEGRLWVQFLCVSFFQ